MRREETSHQPLSGKGAVVTGGSGAIGGAVALRLARLGAAIGVGYYEGASRAEAIVDRVHRMGGTARAFQVDVRSEQACGALIKTAVASLGSVDILVNAAGVELYRLASETTAVEWSRVMETNVQGAFFCSQAALEYMVRRGWGRIVNIGSLWGEVGAAGEVAYSASKAALTGMTKALAKEVARSNVTVNVVAPGVVDTPMVAGFDEAEREALLQRIPVGRLGTGDDIAGAAAFLAGADAGYVTGHVVWVTGGFDPLP